VYPTDTLWGLGASVRSTRAVDEVLKLKDRPSGQPMSVAFSSTEEVERYAVLGPRERRWVRRLLPGPVTLLLRPSPWARRTLPAAVVGHGMTLGVRIPDHPVARSLAQEAGPITATSANRHGAPPVTSGDEARRVFGPLVRCYVTDGPAPSGRPSEIIDLTREPPLVVGR
jgi:L-threonylcarbamoyladenylate synthase